VKERGGKQAECGWRSADPESSHDYLSPALLDILGNGANKSLLDLGCGNGSLTARLADAGYSAIGSEYSESGVAQARSAFPNIDFLSHDINKPLPEELQGSFDVIVAVEVVEHLWFPRELFQRAAEGLKPDGKLVITTPFHGYWKNLALAITNKYDDHWHPYEDFGHVKFFSGKTLTAMAVEQGFRVTEFRRVGRIPVLAKSMIMVCERVSTPGAGHRGG
jgi:2-polyprenyl-3-methyl-5-hydroxy-6-metoxy-1,4-benzoquinol methylase